MHLLLSNVCIYCLLALIIASGLQSCGLLHITQIPGLKLKHTAFANGLRNLWFLQLSSTAGFLKTYFGSGPNESQYTIFSKSTNLSCRNKFELIYIKILQYYFYILIKCDHTWIKPEWVFFSSVVQKKMLFWRMLLSKQLTVATEIHSMKKKYGSKWLPIT